MAAAATSRQDLPPKTPVRTAPAKDHPLQNPKREEEGGGEACRLPIGGCAMRGGRKGAGRGAKRGRNLPKKGVDRGRLVFGRFLAGVSSFSRWTLVVVSLDADRRRLSGRWSSSSLWTLVVVVSLDSCRRRLLDFSAGHLLSGAERLQVPRCEARAQ